MPKKGSNTLKSGQPNMAIPPHMKSHLTRSSSSSRKGVSIQKLIDMEEDDMEVDEDEGGGADDGEDDNVVEVLNMLQEFQKRKATKSTARSAAFQRDKAALFTEFRTRAGSDVRKGMGSIETARATIADLKAKEVSKETTFATLGFLRETQDECIQAMLGNLTGVVEDLSHKRAAQINEASASLELQTAAREKSRKRLLATANSRIAENMDNQKIVSDATALIKHYKALLLS